MHFDKKLTILFMRFLFAFLLIFCAFNALATVNLDYISGSDILVGSGAKATSLGGAFTAVSDDATAIYWNPAGLSLQKTNDLMIIGDSDKPNLEFAAITYHFNDKHHTSLAAAYNTRLLFRGLGDWGNDERAKDLLYLSMLTYYMDFSKPEWQGIGGVDSKTTDFRIALSSQISENINMGLTYVNYRCKTSFYGAWENNVCTILKGQNINAGILVNIDATTAIGFSAINLFRQSELPTPYFLSLGAKKIWHDDFIFSSDIENVYGKNGNHSSLNFWLFKLGGEWLYHKKHHFRAGFSAPLALDSTQVTNLKDKLSLNIIPAIGYGYQYNQWLVEASLMPNVGYAYVENKIKPEAKLAITYQL